MRSLHYLNGGTLLYFQLNRNKFAFINNDNLRRAFRLEFDAIESAFQNRQWKTATVMAGALLEALLFWALNKSQHALNQLSSKPSSPLHEWILAQMIEVARAAKLITEETKTQAKLAKEFRNLIHPAQIVKAQQKCTKGTAHATLAAVDRVVENLTSYFGSALNEGEKIGTPVHLGIPEIGAR